MFSILISTKNRKTDLLYTLGQIKPLISRKDVSCVVFDDGSNDGTSEAVAQNFPEIKLKRNTVSKGYLYCRNTMLNETKSEFAVSLDDDAHFLSENPLEKIEAHFKQNPQCGLIAFRIIWTKEQQQNFEVADPAQRVRGFVGCGHAWNMQVWRSIRNYPEWFEFYGEEEFAALELFRNKYTVDYVPEIFVQHRVDLKKRTMAGKDFEYRYRRSLRSGWYLYFLFYPTAKIPKKMAYSLWMQFKTKIFKGNFKVVVPILYAVADVLTNTRLLIKQRRALTSKEYQEYMQLKETKIYWNPEK